MNDLKRHENGGRDKPQTLPRTFETRPPYLRDKLEPGMLLLGAGDERESAVLIGITAVGCSNVLASKLARHGGDGTTSDTACREWRARLDSEALWSLDQRQWSIVTAAEMENDGMPAEVVARMREFEAIREAAAAAQRQAGNSWRDDKIGDLEKVIAEQNAEAKRAVELMGGIMVIPCETESVLVAKARAAGLIQREALRLNKRVSELEQAAVEGARREAKLHEELAGWKAEGEGLRREAKAASDEVVQLRHALAAAERERAELARWEAALRGDHQRLMPEGYDFIAEGGFYGCKGPNGGVGGLPTPSDAVRRAWVEMLSQVREERDEVRAMLDEAMTARDRFKAELDLATGEARGIAEDAESEVSRLKRQVADLRGAACVEQTLSGPWTAVHRNRLIALQADETELGEVRLALAERIARLEAVNPDAPKLTLVTAIHGLLEDAQVDTVNREDFKALARFRSMFREKLMDALHLGEDLDDEPLLLKACSAIAGDRVLDQVREALATPPMACVVTHAKVITARREEAEAGLRELVAVLGEPFGPDDPVFGRAPSQDATDECKGLATAAVLSIGRERIAAIGRSLDAHRRSTILPAAMEEAFSRISALGRGLHKVAEALGCGHKVPPPPVDVDPPSVERTVDAILGAIHSIRQRANVLEMLLGGYGRLAVELAQDEADKGNALLGVWSAEKNAETVLAAKVDYIRQRARRAPTADVGALDRLVLAVLPDSAIVGALQGTAKDKEAAIIERVKDLRVRRDFAEVALAWFAQYTKRAPKDLIAKWAGVDPRAALDLQGEWVRSQLVVSLERKAENEHLSEVAQQAHAAMDALRAKVRDAIA